MSTPPSPRTLSYVSMPQNRSSVSSKQNGGLNMLGAPPTNEELIYNARNSSNSYEEIGSRNILEEHKKKNSEDEGEVDENKPCLENCV